MIITAHLLPSNSLFKGISTLQLHYATVTKATSV